jgi:UDP-N-acetylglucosamine:LPS N-acetylglucosamine transferase
MKILAVASGGGHWIELLRLRPSFRDHTVHYVTVQDKYRSDVAGSPFHLVRDATRWQRFALLIQALQVCWIVAKVRPDIVISTGAAPGYFALRLGKMWGARTIWLDSLAHVEVISKAGAMSGPYADLWLTQWPELATEAGPDCAGKVI